MTNNKLYVVVCMSSVPREIQHPLIRSAPTPIIYQHAIFITKFMEVVTLSYFQEVKTRGWLMLCECFDSENGVKGSKHNYSDRRLFIHACSSRSQCSYVYIACTIYRSLYKKMEISLAMGSCSIVMGMQSSVLHTLVVHSISKVVLSILNPINGVPFLHQIGGKWWKLSSTKYPTSSRSWGSWNSQHLYSKTQISSEMVIEVYFLRRMIWRSLICIWMCG